MAKYYTYTTRLVRYCSDASDCGTLATEITDAAGPWGATGHTVAVRGIVADSGDTVILENLDVCVDGQWMSVEEAAPLLDQGPGAEHPAIELHGIANALARDFCSTRFDEAALAPRVIARPRASVPAFVPLED